MDTIIIIILLVIIGMQVYPMITKKQPQKDMEESTETNDFVSDHVEEGYYACGCGGGRKVVDANITGMPTPTGMLGMPTPTGMLGMPTPTGMAGMPTPTSMRSGSPTPTPVSR